ncbi:MAG TPA: tetratricopeptide repeat protein [Rhizomicrobium sp.]
MTDTIAAPADKHLNALLSQALVHLQRDNFPDAERLVSGALAIAPDRADALHMLGLVRRGQGRAAEAEQLYRRSIELDPSQPATHYNLGVLFRSTARPAMAVPALREAVRLKPNYTTAHLALGLAFHDQFLLEEAEKQYRQALRLQPNYLMARQSLGAVLNDLKRPKEAESVLRSALAGAGNDPRQMAALEVNLAVSLQRQQKHDEALKLFDSAQARVPDIAHVDYNRGNSFQAKGLSAQALESYRQAVRREPLNMEAHLDLNQLLYRLGDDENFLHSYDEAAAVHPQMGVLPLNKGYFLLQAGNYEAANEEFSRAVSMLTGNVSPLDGQGLALARLGRFEEAIRAHETALRIEPENAEVLCNLGETLIRAGDAEKARAMLEKSLAIEPYHQGTLAMWTTALDLLQDPRGEALADYEKLVQVFELDPPEGFSDMESFNNELGAYLAQMHTDKREVVTQSLRGGTQTMENLFNRGHDLVERLRARIDEAVTTYIGRMKADETHPLLKRRREGFGYSGSWSSRLHDCGFHTNHFHPKGWISSAYYVALPDVVDSGDGQQGWIKFGEPAFEAGLKTPIRRAVQPRAGRLVLFPSYMWHGTVPFQSPAARLTIAFDAIPK